MAEVLHDPNVLPDDLPAPQDDGAARHLINGLDLPDMSLASSRGDAVNLSTRKGAAVVFVYPWTGRPGVANPPGWDDIPGAHGSTPETEGFRDHYLRFRAQRIEVFGLSSQSGERSEEHTFELQSRLHLVCRLLLEKKKKMDIRVLGHA